MGQSNTRKLPRQSQVWLDGCSFATSAAKNEACKMLGRHGWNYKLDYMKRLPKDVVPADRELAKYVIKTLRSFRQKKRWRTKKVKLKPKKVLKVSITSRSLSLTEYSLPYPPTSYEPSPLTKIYFPTFSKHAYLQYNKGARFSKWIAEFEVKRDGQFC